MPRGSEVVHELLLRVVAGVDLGECPQFGVRTEPQVNARRGPLRLSGGALAPLVKLHVDVCGRPHGAHVHQVHEEVVAQRARTTREHAVRGAVEVRAHRTHAAHECGHLWSRQREQVSLVDEQLLGPARMSIREVVAEAIGSRLEHRERCRIGVVGGCISAARREWHRHGETCCLRGILDGRASCKHDEVRERHLLLRAGVGSVELGLDRLERLQDLRELRRIVRRPVPLGREANARTVGAAALVGAAEGGCRSPRGAHELSHRQPRCHHLGLERRNVLRVDKRVRDCRNGILPDQRLLRHHRAEVTGLRSHVAVGELEPRTRERVSELGRVLVEAARDWLVRGIHAQRQVRRQHHWRMPALRVMRVRYGALRGLIGGDPLVRSCRTLRELPLVAEERVEVAVVPLRRRGSPCALEAAGDGVAAVTGAEAALPPESHLVQRRGLRIWTEVGRRSGTVVLAEGVAACDQRHGLIVVHGHAPERLADVVGGKERVGVAVGPLGVHVDEPHLNGRERVLELTLAAVALVSKPRSLNAPVGPIRLPHIGTAAAKAERLESHRFERHVAGQDHEVSPRELAAVLALDGPQQAPRLVEVDVVGPAVERRETLHSGARTATAIADAVGARGVPRHADEERPVVAVVRRPPRLRIGHQRAKVGADRSQVKRPELLGVVEPATHRIRLLGVAAQHREVDLVRPPVAVCHALGRALLESAHEGATACRWRHRGAHVISPCLQS